MIRDLSAMVAFFRSSCTALTSSSASDRVSPISAVRPRVLSSKNCRMLRLNFITGSFASWSGFLGSVGLPHVTLAAGGLPVAAGGLPVAAVGLLRAAAGLLAAAAGLLAAANGFADSDVAVHSVDLADFAMNKTYNFQAFARLDCKIMKLLLAASQTLQHSQKCGKHDMNHCLKCFRSASMTDLRLPALKKLDLDLKTYFRGSARPHKGREREGQWRDSGATVGRDGSDGSDSGSDMGATKFLRTRPGATVERQWDVPKTNPSRKTWFKVQIWPKHMIC